MFLFFATSIVFGRASINIRNGATASGITLGALNFYIVFNVLLGLIALIFLAILSRRTFAGRPLKGDGLYAFTFILVIFVGSTIANAVYLGRIDRYQVQRQRQTFIGNLIEQRRINAIPVSEFTIDTFWWLNVFASTFIIFQITFATLKYLSRKNVSSC